MICVLIQSSLNICGNVNVAYAILLRDDNKHILVLQIIIKISDVMM
jgi:hypothetical protein